METTQPPATETKREPIKRHNDGRLSYAIWENPGEHGKIYNVTFGYSYKDKNGQWQTTQSIPGNEMLKTSYLAKHAYANIALFKEQDRAERIQQQQNVAVNGHSPEHHREH